MKSAPKMVDYLNEESKEFFEKVLGYLDAMGIEYELDSNLVRGLDYYSHTVFEVQADIKGFGSQNTLCGGGRYDGLVEELGGPSTPGVGFGMGIERLLLALEAEEIQVAKEQNVDVYLMPIGDEAKKVSAGLQNHLRLNGFVTDSDYLNKKMKAQFKQADRNGATFIVIFGEDELNEGVCNVKTVPMSTEEKVAINQLTAYLENKMYELHQASHSHGCGCGSNDDGGCCSDGNEEHECCGGDSNCNCNEE
jgi:histidyl-tRNA synthetase